MLLIYYFTKPVFWIIPWILQSIGYFRVLRKVDMDGKWAIVPFAAEGKLSTILFESMSSYWHPLVIAGPQTPSLLHPSRLSQGPCLSSLSQTANSHWETLMLGKIEGRRRRG